MTNRMRLPKMTSRKPVMRASLATTEDEFDPKKAKLDTPSPQTVLQMQQTFGNQATIQMLRDSKIQRLKLADAAAQLNTPPSTAPPYKELFSVAEKKIRALLGNPFRRWTTSIKSQIESLDGDMYDMPQMIRLAPAENVTSIDECMNKPGAWELFKEHLEKEFALENAMFLEEVEKYKRAPSLIAAEVIYDHYIISGSAKYEINIDYHTRNAYGRYIGGGLIESNPTNVPQTLRDKKLQPEVDRAIAAVAANNPENNDPQAASYRGAAVDISDENDD